MSPFATARAWRRLGRAALAAGWCRRLALAGVAAGGVVLACAAGPVHAATFTVTSTGDLPDAAPGDGICSTAPSGGVCTLRAAIQEANALAGPDTVAFGIGSGARTIGPTSPLPTIEDALTIDGTTQPGFAGAPVIELTGAAAGASADGLRIAAGRSSVRGLAINRFARAGIQVSRGAGSAVEGCFIGTDVTGTAARGNDSGVTIGGAHDTIVGGTTPAARNVISGNRQDGVSITFGATGTRVEGNLIGTDVTGTLDLGNAHEGVFIGEASQNAVGGRTEGAGNVISGNGTGVSVSGVGATGNVVQGNLIGTTAAGMAPLGNSLDGVTVGNRASDNTIGGRTAGARNVISGNGQSGVTIGGGFDPTGNRVEGNLIGTDVAGTAAIANRVGVTVGGSDNAVGGAAGRAGNVISGNRDIGVRLVGARHRVEGNLIGTDATGTTALANGRGVVVEVAPSRDHVIGGTTGRAGNVISGNRGGGVVIVGGAGSVRVQGNFIGTDITGGNALGNAGAGVEIIGAADNTIGGATGRAGNVISANGHSGVLISGGTATGNRVQGNRVGTDADGSRALGNGGHGVFVVDAPGNTIGGERTTEGNTIVHNTFAGVRVQGHAAAGNRVRGNVLAANGTRGVVVDLGATGTAILENAIVGNRLLGIDLGPFGVTPSDPGDADRGANELQNAPTLTSAANTGGATTVAGRLHSSAGATFRIEVFVNERCDPSGHGEGERFFGATTVTTDGDGDAGFSVRVAAVPAGRAVTATATDAGGNTSEFSACAPVTAP